MPEVEFIGEFGTDSVIQRAMETKDDVEVARIRQMGAVTTTVVKMVQDYLTSCEVREDEVLLKEDGHPLTIGDVKGKISLWLAERGAIRCGRRHFCHRSGCRGATFGWRSRRSDDARENDCL